MCFPNAPYQTVWSTETSVFQLGYWKFSTLNLRGWMPKIPGVGVPGPIGVETLRPANVVQSSNSTLTQADIHRLTSTDDKQIYSCIYLIHLTRNHLQYSLLFYSNGTYIYIYSFHYIIFNSFIKPTIKLYKITQCTWIILETVWRHTV